MASDTVVKGFLSSVERFSERTALIVEGESYTYRQLYDAATRLAAALQPPDTGRIPTVGIFGYRSALSFSGILAALMKGYAYVPLNRTFPPDRTAYMIERSGCSAMFVDADSAGQLSSILPQINRPLTMFLPRAAIDNRIVGPHTLCALEELPAGTETPVTAVDDDAAAYILFTSGSTGKPKGVVVGHRNVRAFVQFMAERYQITEHDRFSQTFDNTFDLSVFDMFMAWERGACVVCPPKKALMNASGYIRKNQLTVWFSVPSLAIQMGRLGLLKPAAFPSLRFSLFCGEPLPVSVAEQWQQAAPGATLENLYGPTELTISCTYYRWNPLSSPHESVNGIVPIGYLHDGLTARICDDTLAEVPVGEKGELCVSGPQVALGYLDDPRKTAAAFVTPPGAESVYYRTGDLVIRPADSQSPLIYLGRVDSQIKVLGHRVELGEIESRCREALGTPIVVALGWPISESGAEGIEIFTTEETTIDEESFKQQLERTLPSYMIPSRVHRLRDIPLNPNGKFDRNALLTLLKEGR